MNSIKNTEKYFIGLDIGTSALKGVLTNARGDVIVESGTENAFLYPQEDWIELDPETHYQNICRIIRTLNESAPGEVSALSMAAASGNTLLTDSDGLPLTNIISWMDNRAVQHRPRSLTGLTSEEVALVTGWPCVTTFPLAHLAWLHENKPLLFTSSAHVGMDTDWLLYRLTGEWVMDNSTATTFHLQEQTSGTYYMPFLKRIGLNTEKLSRLLPSGVAVGPLTSQALKDTSLSEKTLVVTGCFDHPAAARASGVVEEGQLMLSCGTSWVGFMPHPDRKALVKAKLLCDPFLSASGGAWGGMFSVPRIGRKIDWYVEHLIAPGEKACERMRTFDNLAAQAESGAGGLSIDLRETPSHINASPENISRAVMEGAARLLNDEIVKLTRYGFNYRQATMVGGPSRSPVWPGIVAEITGLDVTVADRSAGARGAAILAMEGFNNYCTESVMLTAQG